MTRTPVPHPSTEERTGVRPRGREAEDRPAEGSAKTRPRGLARRRARTAPSTVIVRRGLPVLSAILLVLGLELATGMIGQSLHKLVEVASALLNGQETAASLPAYFTGLAAMVAGVAGLGASVWSRLHRSRIAEGRSCPVCGADTRRVHRRLRHRLVSAFLGERLQRRLCRECGWKGLTRVR